MPVQVAEICNTIDLETRTGGALCWEDPSPEFEHIFLEQLANVAIELMLATRGGRECAISFIMAQHRNDDGADQTWVGHHLLDSDCFDRKQTLLLLCCCCACKNVSIPT